MYPTTPGSELELEVAKVLMPRILKMITKNSALFQEVARILLFNVVKNTSFEVFPHITQKGGGSLLISVVGKPKSHFTMHNLLKSLFGSVSR